MFERTLRIVNAAWFWSTHPILAALSLSLAFISQVSADERALASTPDHLALYIFIGQSNMSGRGPLEELPTPWPPAINGEQPNIWNFTNAGVWEPAREPIDLPVGEKRHEAWWDEEPLAGPILSFGVAMHALAPDQPIGLIPCARQGSNLRDWRRSTNDRSLYGWCMNRVKAAQAMGTLRGIVFYLGETDSHERKSARSFDDHFVELINHLRTDVSGGAQTDLPIVFTQIATVSDKRKRRRSGYRYWSYVKRAQAEISLPHAALVKADRYPIQEDGIHLTTAGYISLGQEWAKAMYALQSAAPPL
ncbi:MAG: sialate O-acetylesterase [Pseudomonadota bacterium]